MQTILHHLKGFIVASLILLGFITILAAASCEPQADPIPVSIAPLQIEPYFEPLELAYNPCTDPLLKYERSIESEERKRQCGVE